MRVWVCGRRYFNDWNVIRKGLKENLNKEDIVRTGLARGTDKVAEAIIIQSRLCRLGESIEPDWRPDGEFNVMAGMDRNTEGVDWCEKVIAFWDNSMAGGTWDVIWKAREQEKEVVIIEIV